LFAVNILIITTTDSFSDEHGQRQESPRLSVGSRIGNTDKTQNISHYLLCIIHVIYQNLESIFLQLYSLKFALKMVTFPCSFTRKSFSWPPCI